MEDARVWTMTVAVVGAGALLCVLCGGLLVFGSFAALGARTAASAAPIPAAVAVPAGPAPPPAPDTAVVLADTPLRAEATTAAEHDAVLPAGAVVTVLERSAERYTCRDPDCRELRHEPLEFEPEGEGDFGYRVRTADGGEGWVFGRDLAVRAGSAFVAGLPDLGWDDRGVIADDLDGDGTAELLWFAVRDVGYEWPGGTLDPTPSGALVVEDPDTGLAATHRVAGIVIGGYGDRVGELRFRDVDGDRAGELLLRIDVTVSEVGYGGHEVAILDYRDGDLVEVFRQSAGISLIAGVGEYRWDRLELGPDEITLDAVDLEVFSACRAWAIEEPDTAVDRCLRREHRVWRHDADAGRFALVSEDDAQPVRARTGPAGVAWRDEPDPGAPTRGSLPPDTDVSVQQVHDWQAPAEVDGHPTHWVRAVADDGRAGWVPAAQLRFADGMLQPYMHGDHSAEAQVSPVVW